MFLQEGVGAHDEARRAVAALGRSLLGEGFLNGVQPLALRQPFDGQHLRSLGLRGQHAAGIDGAPVEHDAAAAAVAGPAN